MGNSNSSPKANSKKQTTSFRSVEFDFELEFVFEIKLLPEKPAHARRDHAGKQFLGFGGSFVSALLEADLIDELNLFVNPAAIGKGMPIFDQLSSLRRFQLLEARAFECGIAVLKYALIKA